MKTAFVVSAQPTSFEALTKSIDLEESVKLVARSGFDGVEIAIRDPERFIADTLTKLTLDNGLEFAAIGTGQAFVDEGLSLTHIDHMVRYTALDRIKKQIDLSAKVGAMVILGLIRGKPAAGYELETSRWLFAGALQELARYAESVDAPPLLVEPINRYETRLINSVDECISFLSKLKLPNVKILIDTFHMNIEDANMVDSIKRAGDMIGHAHIADSNRHAPGQGHINFDEIFNALEDIGYNGYVSAEILPLPSVEDSIKLTAQFFKASK